MEVTGVGNAKTIKCAMSYKFHNLAEEPEYIIPNNNKYHGIMPHIQLVHQLP